MSLRKGQPKNRRLILCCVFALAAFLMAARICWVNITLPKIPLEHFDMGEWVELDGSFQMSSGEGTREYALMVESANVMTYGEYLAAYGGDARRESSGNNRCVLDLALRIKRSGSPESVESDQSDTGGYINIFQTVLVPSSSNKYLICDVVGGKALWPQVQQGAGMQIHIRPGTEYLAHIPYVLNTAEPYEEEIVEREFTLLASRMPVRKMIRVSVRE